MSKNIQVAIKVRPLLRKEKEQKLSSCWKIFENSIQLAESQSDPFCFDHIFDQDASNQIIFEKMAKHIVHSGIQGFNGTIFAYGQTSSGKTYTMMGDEQNPGVMVLAAKEIFKQIEKSSDRQFLLRVGYIEIYNEKIYDLLNKKNQDLKIHETSSGNVSVNCEECIITCEDELLNHLCMGSKERTVGETNMNERSSRSHAIFRIIIESRKMDRSEDDSVNQSVLNLVDLAGSERADQTGARGTRLKEGGHINKSLLFLSNVIKLLSESTDGDKYISYRDSKLTRILQASLGGNALTSIICTITPTAVEETQSTLSFAVRAKSIKNKPQVNEVVSEAAMMKRLEREINMLKSQLAEERSKNKSQIKVGQLEQRIKTEVVKIISCNSLHYLKHQKDKRRRTWCPANSKMVDASTLGVQTLPLSLLSADNATNDAGGTNNNAYISGLPVPTMFPTTHMTSSKLQLPKPSKYFTPKITARSMEDYSQADTNSQSGETPRIQEEVFEPAENCNFDRFSPLNRSNNSQISAKGMENFSTISITPKVTANVHSKLQIVENALVELEEFTNLENKLDIKYDTYEALKQRFELIQDRNALLETERLEYIALKDDHLTTQKNLDDTLKRCDELEIQINEVTNLHRNATEKITNYEKLFEELNNKLHQLEMENREAVSLEFEFQSHKNKSKLREVELLEALAEKEKEILKLERSLHSINEEKLHNSKQDLMQLSRSESIDETGQTVHIKCEDLNRLLEENKKVTQEFDKLTLEYERLKLDFKRAVEDATQAQSKVSALEEVHSNDVAECDILRAEIAAIRETLEKVQIDYATLNSDYQSKSEDFEALNRTINDERVKMQLLQVKYDRLEGAWHQQQQTIDDIQKEYDSIQLKYQELQVEYEKLESTSESIVNDCAQLQAKNECLQTEINELQMRVEEAQRQLTEKVKRELTEQAQSELTEQAQSEPTEQAQSEPTEQAQSELTEQAQSELTEQAQSELTEQTQSEPTEQAQSEPTEQAQSELTQQAQSELTEQAQSKATEQAERQLAEQAQKERSPSNTDALESELEEQKLQNAKLKAELKDLHQQFEEMQKEYDDLSNQLMDQLQDGELLKDQNNKLEAQLAVLREQATKQSSKFSSNKERLLSADGLSSPALDSSEQRRYSVTTLGSGVSESMRSSGLGLDDVDPPLAIATKTQQQLLSHFAQLAEAFDEIELEYAAGQKRCFVFSDIRQQDKSQSSYRLLIKDIQEIVRYDLADDEESAKSFNNNNNNMLLNGGHDDITNRCMLAMRGSFARHTFKILESNRRKNSAEESKSTSTNEISESIQLNAEIKRLDEENQQLKTLLGSMEQVINEMRDKMTKLSEELLEKSMFVEKCACKMYQKQIETLEREKAEMTIFCEELQSRTLDASPMSLKISTETLPTERNVDTSQDERDIHRDCNGDDETLDGPPLDRSSYSFDNKRAESTATLAFQGSNMSLSLCLSRISEEEDKNLNETLKDDENKRALKDADELQINIKKLNEEIFELQKTVASLEEKLESEQKNLKYKEQSFDELNTRYQALEKQLAALQAEHEEQMKVSELAKQEDFELKQKEYKVEIDRIQLDLCEKLEIIETEGRERLRRHREWEECKSNYERKIDELRRNLELEKSLKDKRECKCEALTIMEEENRRLKGDLRSFTDMQNEFNAIKLAKETTENQLRESEKVLEETNKIVTIKSEEINQMQSRLEELKQANQLLVEEKTINQEKVTQIKEKLMEIQQFNRKDKNEKTHKFGEDGKSAESAELSAAEQEKVDKLSGVQKEFEDIHSKLSEIMRTRHEQQEKLDHLENCLQESERSLNECNQKLILKTNQLNEKQLDLDKLSVERKRLLDEVEVLEKRNLSYQDEKNEMQRKLACFIEEKQQVEFASAQLQRQLKNAEEQLQELEDSENKQQQLIKELREQLKCFETLRTEHEQLQKDAEERELKKCQELREQLEKYESLSAKHEQLQQNMDGVQQKHDDSLKRLQQEKEQLQETLKHNQVQLKEAEQKVEMLNSKIGTLLQDLREVKENASNYEKLLVDYHQVTKTLELAKEEKKMNASKIQLFQEQLQTSKREADAAQKNNCDLQQKLIASQTSEATAKEEERRLRMQLVEVREQLAEVREQLGEDYSQLVHEKRELQSTIEELQLKCRMLSEHNERLQQTSSKAEEQLRAAQAQEAECVSHRQQLESLKMEKQELQAQLMATFEKASKCSQSLREDVEKQKEKLEKQLEAYQKLRSLMENKEAAHKDEKKKLEGTIECLLGAKKTLEERLYATELALKKYDELSSKKKMSDSPNSLDMDKNISSSSPRSKSYERLMGENNQLKAINMNLEDKLMSLQQKTLQSDSVERKNRRLSTHDERRRQSLWGSFREVTTMTDPTDSTCNCVELDRKLKECEKNLFIRESQVTALNMELKNNPLKYENSILKKRLQEEQEKARNEIRKYKEIIIEQKTRAANALLAASKDAVVVSGVAAATASEKPTNKSSIIHVETQTDSEVETTLRKLEGKYNDLKNICRFRHSVIKELEEKIASLTKDTTENPSSSKLQLSSLEAGQIKSLQQQCESLKKELRICKQKYDDAKTVLCSRRAEIQSLRAQLEMHAK